MWNVMEKQKQKRKPGSLYSGNIIVSQNVKDMNGSFFNLLFGYSPNMHL